MLDVRPDSAMTHQDSVAAAMAALGGPVESGGLGALNVPIGSQTTYRVGGAADVFVRITSRHDLRRVAAALSVSGLPLLIIGRGSNLLVADAGFRGIAVSMTDLAANIAIDTDSSIVTASAGILLPVLARRTAAAGLTGFEWAVGVPGSVGGAVRMNAGGHGSDMAATLIDVTLADLLVDVPAGEHRPAKAPVAEECSVERVLDVGELGLRFRGSSLPPRTVVLGARLQLTPGDTERAEREITEIVAWRRANQPGGQNAGSVFVNPVPGEVTAGALIDASGLSGMRFGSACVSEKHANFIQVDEDGSADDVRALMRMVRERVAADSGFVLRSENRLVGFEEEL